MTGWTIKKSSMPATGGLPQPGRYLAIVQDAKFKTSRGGDEMVNYKLVDANTLDLLCYDIIMLAGNGLGIGMGKGVVLGVVDSGVDNDGEEVYRVADLVEWDGAGCVVDIIHEEYDHTDRETGEVSTRTRCKPDFKSGAWFGYYPESTWKAGPTQEPSPQTDGGQQAPPAEAYKDDDSSIPF